MKPTYFILLVILCTKADFRLNLASNIECICEELSQNDCALVPYACYWGNQTCKTLPKNCNNLNSTVCNIILGCALNVNNTCAVFTKCEDYLYTDTTKCYSADPSCSAGTPCITQTIASCQTVQDQLTCEGYGCLYKNKTCQEKRCSDINTQIECTTVGSNLFKNIDLCSWSSNGACVQGSINQLNSQNCFYLTQGTYRWSDSACTACKGTVNNTSTTQQQDLGSSSCPILALVGLAAATLFI